jgi:ribulose-5-phosphate 4-epimerase/fuculose-1-phosphate aldolase
MKKTEGVIKYELKHQNCPLDKDISIAEINAWRTIFFKLNLIGQDKQRYDGYGFGNISQKLSGKTANLNQFIISGTQTGGEVSLCKQQYCTVLNANPRQNSIQSAGETKPSSEALTHASIYQTNTTTQAIIHVHSPDIWQKTEQLKLPFTDAAIVYGSVEMAIEVEKIVAEMQPKTAGIFSMLGHEDGIVAFSDSMEKATTLLLANYAKALAFRCDKEA